MSQHNHATRDIKRPGRCPACDEYRARRSTQDVWDTPEGRDWVKQHNENLRPMIRDSALSMMLWPADGEPDAKIAVELGFILMLGKPLVILKPSGANIPPTLARIVDAIVEYDDQVTEDVVHRAQAEGRRILAERGEATP